MLKLQAQRLELDRGRAEQSDDTLLAYRLVQPGPERQRHLVAGLHRFGAAAGGKVDGTSPHRVEAEDGHVRVHRGGHGKADGVSRGHGLSRTRTPHFAAMVDVHAEREPGPLQAGGRPDHEQKRSGRGEPDAQEALQEVFASLLRAPQSLRNAASVVGWLYQATTHFCLNLLRHQRTGARLLQARIAPAPAPGCRGEALAELRSVLSRLPAEVAAAAVYHHMDGMTHDEVAALLGCSRRKVGYLLERVQQSLARLERSA